MARMYTPRQLSAVKCLDEAVNSRRNRGDDTPWTSGHTMEVWMYDRELGQLSVKELREARRRIRQGQRK